MKGLIEQVVKRKEIDLAEDILSSLTGINSFVNGFIRPNGDGYDIVSHWNVDGEPNIEMGQSRVYYIEPI